MSLLASRIGGCQSFGGFTTCFPSVTNHSNRGQPAETETWSHLKPNETMHTHSQWKQNRLYLWKWQPPLFVLWAGLSDRRQWSVPTWRRSCPTESRSVDFPHPGGAKRVSVTHNDQNRKIQNNFEKGCAEGMWELLMEWKQGNDKKKKKPQSITAASKQQQVSKRSDGQSLLKTLLLCIKARL